MVDRVPLAVDASGQKEEVPLGDVISPTRLPFFQLEENLVAATTAVQPSVPDNILIGTFPAQYITLTTPALDVGDYVLEWDYYWNHDATSNDFLARVRQNLGAAFFGFHRAEPQDAAGGGAPDAPPGSGTNQRYTASGRKQLLALSGVQTFDIEFATSAAGVESTMISATLSLRRYA